MRHSCLQSDTCLKSDTNGQVGHIPSEFGFRRIVGRITPLVYLERLLPGGDLHQPQLLSPKPCRRSKVSQLLHSLQVEHGEGEQVCAGCGSWGDHPVCVCFSAFYCDAICLERDETHDLDCQKNQKLIRPALLNSRAATLTQKQAEMLTTKVETLQDILDDKEIELEQLRKKLKAARSRLARPRRVSRLEGKLGRVPVVRRGDRVLALSLHSSQTAVTMNRIEHPGKLEVWEGRMEMAADPVIQQVHAANAAIALTPTAQEDGNEHEAAAEAPQAVKKRGRRRKLPIAPKPQPRYHRKDRRTYVNLGRSHAMAFSKVLLHG